MRKHRPHIIRRRGRPQKSPPWIKYELKTREDLDRFLVDAIRLTWTGKLGTRQASSVNGSIRLLMELRGWRQLPPIVPPVEQPREWTDEEKKVILGRLTEDEQIEFCRLINKLEGKEDLGPPGEKDQRKRPECPEA